MTSENGMPATRVHDIVRRCGDCGSTDIREEAAEQERTHHGPQPAICWPGRCRHFSQFIFSNGSEPKRCSWCGGDYSQTQELTTDEYISAMFRNHAATLD